MAAAGPAVTSHHGVRADPHRVPLSLLSPRVSWLFLGIGSLAVAVSAASPASPAGTVAYAVLGLGSMTAIVVGIRRNRPASVRPWWWLFAAGTGAVLAGTLRSTVEASAETGMLIALSPDLMALTAYVALGLSLMGMHSARRTRRSSAAVADGALLALAAWLPAWSVLIEPALGDDTPLAYRVINSAYPPVDVILIFLLARLALTQVTSVAAFRMVVMALACLLLGDLAWALNAAHVVSAPGSALTFAYGVGLLGVGAAALHPTMRVLTQPQPVRIAPLGRGRLVSVSLAMFVPAVVTFFAPPQTLLQRGIFSGTALALVTIVLWRVVNAVNEHATSEARLSHQALHDPLTALPNRLRLAEHIDRCLQLALSTRAGVGVVFLDLDRFKYVNDTWGHAVGDELLNAIAGRLRAVMRPGDLLARVGGDEFVIACSGLASADEAVRVADRLLEEFETSFTLSMGEVFMRPSVGVSYSSGLDGGAAETLVQEADTAMYQAKEAGRTSAALFDLSMRDRIARRLDVETALRNAIGNGELRLDYQPIVDVQSGDVLGFEALMRWAHPGLGQVSPVDFIPVAEESGLIVDLGRWALEEAIGQLAVWSDDAGLQGRSLWVAVNVSARQLRDTDLVAHVARLLQEHAVAPEKLHIEITESVMLEDGDAVTTALHGLRALGVELSADDFGTGYSSLSYLKRFPISCVKIDRSFVTGLGHDADDDAIVKAVLAMARALGLSVVAEGVETREQYEVLGGLGCDSAQGYLLSPPLNAAYASDLLLSGLPLGPRAARGATRRAARQVPAPRTELVDR